MTFLRKLLTDNRGIATIEYGVIALLLGTGLIASMQSLGSEVDSSFNALKNHMIEANN
jgi:Flp pilus assembly pilin Flp